MLLKCCTQYVNKFGKLRNGHRTVKCQFSFQPQRRAMPKKAQIPYNCAHFTCYQGYAQNPPSQASAVPELRASRCTSRVSKRQRNQIANCQHSLGHAESKGIPEKHLLLLHWVHQSLWLCGQQQTEENSSRDGSKRPPFLSPGEYYMQVKKQQLELDMEQQTGSKLGKEYVEAVYCHPACLT